MTNKILNTWTFGGIRLSDLGFVTELSGYLDTAAKRSENVMIPAIDGRAHAKKYFGERIIPFGIAVRATSICKIEEKMDIVKALFGIRSQQALTYKAWDGERSALAEVVSQLSVTQDPDPLVVQFVVEFLLAEPFFRSTTEYSHEETIDATPYPFDVVNDGTTEERRSIITFTGPLENPIVRNMGLGVTPDFVYVHYEEHLVAQDTLVVDCYENTAVLKRAFTNDPAAGNNIELAMPYTAGFVVGNTVTVSSDIGGTIESEDAVITVVHVDTHITVDTLALNHTTTDPYVETNVINFMRHRGDPTFMVFTPGSISRPFTNNPGPTAPADLYMPNTYDFGVGDVVVVSSKIGTVIQSETVTITAVVPGSYITVNSLALDHTTHRPRVTKDYNHLHISVNNPTNGKVKIEFYPPYL